MAAWTDERLARIISNLLRTGVLISAAIVMSAGICHLLQHANEPVSYRVFRGEPESYRSVRGVVAGAREGDCLALIQLGLLLLIATPIARVAFSLIGFALEGDRLYTVVTLVVLLILIYSLIGEH